MEDNGNTEIQEQQQDPQERRFTQDEVNRIVADRLERDRKKYAQEAETAAAAHIAELQERDKTISELNTKIKNYELNAIRARVGAEAGIPAELLDRLKGETEGEIRQDAAGLARVIGRLKGAPPLASTEPTNVDDIYEAAFSRGPRTPRNPYFVDDE